jgi:F0F1-type ATP synthase epsilon subunit
VLAGVLRVADGLDRSHQAVARGLSVEIRKGSVTVAAEPASPKADLSRELRAARAKSDVLAAVLGLKIRVQAAKRVSA